MPFYHIWFTTWDNEPLLVGPAEAAARRALAQAAMAGGYELHGVAMAPGHVHMVLHLAQGRDLERAVRGLQAAMAREAGLGDAAKAWAPEYGHKQVPLSDLARVVRHLESAVERGEAST